MHGMTLDHAKIPYQLVSRAVFIGKMVVEYKTASRSERKDTDIR